MALHWRPVGPEPASTYWQRRAVVATAAVLLLAVLFSLLNGEDEAPDRLAEAPASSAPVTPSALPTGSASPSASPAAVAVCGPEALVVEGLVDEDSYAAGGRPKLSLRVTNKGTTPCTSDLGQAAIELLVFSGSDRIWSSDDCAPGGAKDVTTLQPGEAATRRATWDGKRSLPGCEGSKAQAQPGTYRVTARVGQQRVEGDAFRLTG
ncbi:MAG: hypothetical protein JWM62_2651 [Frankiales bacterium]|jgi:hypothetical protein|nr:hypothetical protein [Frankiales bacterium]